MKIVGNRTYVVAVLITLQAIIPLALGLLNGEMSILQVIQSPEIAQVLVGCGFGTARAAIK